MDRNVFVTQDEYLAKSFKSLTNTQMVNDSATLFCLAALSCVDLQHLFLNASSHGAYGMKQNKTFHQVRLNNFDEIYYEYLYTSVECYGTQSCIGTASGIYFVFFVEFLAILYSILIVVLLQL